MTEIEKMVERLQIDLGLRPSVNEIEVWFKIHHPKMPTDIREIVARIFDETLKANLATAVRKDEILRRLVKKRKPFGTQKLYNGLSLTRIVDDLRKVNKATGQDAYEAACLYAPPECFADITKQGRKAIKAILAKAKMTQDDYMQAIIDRCGMGYKSFIYTTFVDY